MSSRRSRIVIKPNIGRAVGKGGSAAQKAKSTLSTASAVLIKSSLATAADEAVENVIIDSGSEKSKLNSSAPETSTSFSSSNERPTDCNTEDAPVDNGTAEWLLETGAPGIQSQPDTKSSLSIDVTNTDEEPAKPQTVEVIRSLTQPAPSLQLPIPSDTPIPFVPPQVSQQDTVPTALKPTATTNEDQELDASDLDSCLSEAVSLEPEEERRGELEEDVQGKKTRRRRIKKQRVEPLPSREKSPDRQKMKMGDLLQWNPQHNFLPKKAKKKVAPLKSVEPICASDSYVTIEEDNEEESNQSASLPAPQVMIGPDGNIVLNTESLIIPSTQNEGKRSKEIIEEDDNDKYLNTNSYRSAKKAKAWTDKETEKFFLGLSMCGTDFSLLTNLLTHRSRRDLKNKFRREEKRNRPLIDKALADRQKYNPTPFEKIAEEVEAKAKPLVKKRMKKEMGQTVEKSVGVKAAKRRKKQKKDRGDEEEGDWDPEYDEEDEENMCVEKETVAMAQTPTTKKRGQMVKAEVNPATSLPSASIAAASPVQKRGRARVIPATSTAPDVDHQSDLDSLRMSARPKKTYAGWKPQTSGSQLAPTNMATTLGGTGNNQSNNRDSGIPAIPGFSQIQIQMEGVQDLVPGVLIPSHIVPTIAPRLGIENPEEGMQVLLAQEETPSGSIVHVYIIPEAEGETTVPGRTEEPADIASQLMTTTVPNPHPKASQTAPQNLAVPSAESNTINKSSNSLASTLAQSSASLYSLPATTSNIHSSSPSTTQAGVRSHPYTDSNPSQDHVQPQLPKQELAMVHTETNTLCSLPDSMNLTLPQNGHTASSSHTVDGTTTCPPIQARCTVIDQPFGNVEVKEQISQPSIKISTNTASDTSVGSNSKVATL